MKNDVLVQALYRPKRLRNGKRIVSRLYSARIRVDGERQGFFQLDDETGRHCPQSSGGGE
jgi:hypothetical protein